MRSDKETLGAVEQGQHKLRENIEESGRLIVEIEQRVSESRLFADRVAQTLRVQPFQS
jgi:hypothetical protein